MRDTPGPIIAPVPEKEGQNDNRRTSTKKFQTKFQTSCQAVKEDRETRLLL